MKQEYHATVVALFSKQECHATATYLNGFFTVSTNMDFSLQENFPPVYLSEMAMDRTLFGCCCQPYQSS
jgi:hypothetical protein